MSDEMRKVVYAVSEGSYSDYSVVGVFSTRGNAEEFMRRIDESYAEWNDIEEMEIDAALPQMRAGFKPWRVRMRFDGSTEDVKESTMSTYNVNEARKREPGIWRRSTLLAYRGQDIEDVMLATIWAIDAAHAVKIANEKRAQLIASGKWSAARSVSEGARDE